MAAPAAVQLHPHPGQIPAKSLLAESLTSLLKVLENQIQVSPLESPGREILLEQKDLALPETRIENSIKKIRKSQLIEEIGPHMKAKRAFLRHLTESRLIKNLIRMTLHLGLRFAAIREQGHQDTENLTKKIPENLLTRKNVPGILGKALIPLPKGSGLIKNLIQVRHVHHPLKSVMTLLVTRNDLFRVAQKVKDQGSLRTRKVIGESPGQIDLIKSLTKKILEKNLHSSENEQILLGLKTPPQV